MYMHLNQAAPGPRNTFRTRGIRRRAGRPPLLCRAVEATGGRMAPWTPPCAAATSAPPSTAAGDEGAAESGASRMRKRYKRSRSVSLRAPLTRRLPGAHTCAKLERGALKSDIRGVAASSLGTAASVPRWADADDPSFLANVP